ncbi:MAG TPA: GTPase ObgE [Bacillota bacterium]|nr:GTPase ObgE [Bacillota bacterium]
MFIDQVKLFLKSGNGGSGAVSFRREKYVPRGGPDGGDGGRGGHIIFVVRSGLTTLSEYRDHRRFIAENGQPGGGVNCSGKDGVDLYLPVPPGTVIRDLETSEIIADLTEEGSEILLLRGGRGGRGNAHFASSTRQTPQFSEKGEPGFELNILLELKLIADVGIIGFPNAGKSTLISRISAAKPKIADYPFTTLIPNLGVVTYHETSFVAVDVPGLIEGAHQGIGLGDQFLRHIERTRILIHLVDISGLSGRDPYQDFCQINEELRLFNAKLAEKPQIIAANKIDLTGAPALLEDFRKRLTDAQANDQPVQVYPISAVTGAGINELLGAVVQKLKETEEKISVTLNNQEIPADKFTDNKFPQNSRTRAQMIENRGANRKSPAELGIEIIKDGAVYIVENQPLIKRIARFDLNNDESVQSLQRLLKRWGVFAALTKAGVKEGDLVKIGDWEFMFQDED